MKKTKVVSVLTILACLFMLIAGALGMSDVMEQKDVKTQEGAEARQQIDTLAAGIEELESNRQTYNEGKQTYEKGLAQYNAGLAKYKASLKEYTEGLATLKSKTADYEKGKITYANGVKEYNAGLSKYNSSLQSYNAGREALNSKTAEYNAGKKAVEAGEEAIAAAESFVATVNTLTTPHDYVQAANIISPYKKGVTSTDIQNVYENITYLITPKKELDSAAEYAAAHSVPEKTADDIKNVYNGVKNYGAKGFVDASISQQAQDMATDFGKAVDEAVEKNITKKYVAGKDGIEESAVTDEMLKEAQTAARPIVREQVRNAINAENQDSKQELGEDTATAMDAAYLNGKAGLKTFGDTYAKNYNPEKKAKMVADAQTAHDEVQHLMDGYTFNDATAAVAEAVNKDPKYKDNPLNKEMVGLIYGVVHGMTEEQAIAAINSLQKRTGKDVLTAANLADARDAVQPNSEERKAIKKGKDQLAAYEAGKKKLDAIEPQLRSAKRQLDAAAVTLANGKASLEEYESGKAKLDAAKPQLEAAKKQLAEAKKALEEGLAKLKTFEDGEKQVEAGKATLTAIAEVQAKVDAGLDVVKAGYEYLDESTVSTTKDLTGKAVANILALLAGVLGIIAGILGLSGKKATRVLATLAVIAAAAALIFALIKDPITAVLIAAILGTVMTLALTLVAKPASVNGAPEENTDTENN